MRIGYARVSTIDQDTSHQVEALKQAGCDLIIQERASGAKADRPELARLLGETLRAGDTLVIWKLDRLARSLKQLIDTALDLKARDISLVSLTDAIDTTTPSGMLLFHILGSIAQFERSLIQQRTRAGLAEAKRQGKTGGRPKVMTPKAIEQAKAMLALGAMSSKEVAERLNVSRAAMYRAIKPHQ